MNANASRRRHVSSASPSHCWHGADDCQSGVCSFPSNFERTLIKLFYHSTRWKQGTAPQIKHTTKTVLPSNNIPFLRGGRFSWLYNVTPFFKWKSTVNKGKQRKKNFPTKQCPPPVGEGAFFCAYNVSGGIICGVGGTYPPPNYKQHSAYKKGVDVLARSVAYKWELLLNGLQK